MRKIIFLILLLPLLVMAQSDLYFWKLDSLPSAPAPPDTGSGEVACTDSLGGWNATSPGTETYTYMGMTKWNMFTPSDSGRAGCFTLYVPGYTGDRTDDSVVCWLYADTLVGGDHKPGRPVVMAWEYHYNWTTVGQDAWHFWSVDSIFNNHGKLDTLDTGENYWMTVWTEPMPTNELAVIRSRTGVSAEKYGDDTLWDFQVWVPVYPTNFGIDYGAAQSVMFMGIYGEILQ